MSAINKVACLVNREVLSSLLITLKHLHNVEKRRPQNNDEQRRQDEKMVGNSILKLS